MRTPTLVALLCGVAGATAALAETIVMPDGQVQMRESSVERPKRGLTMSEVEAKFGAPAEKHATVGQPPITRWDYSSFSVFFEHDRVIHSVAMGGASLPPPPGSQTVAGAARAPQPAQARQAAAPSVPEATLRPGMYKSPPEPTPAPAEAAPSAASVAAPPAEAQQPAAPEPQAAAQQPTAASAAQPAPAQGMNQAAAAGATQPLQADYPLQSDAPLQSDPSAAPHQ